MIGKEVDGDLLRNWINCSNLDLEVVKRETAQEQNLSKIIDIEKNFNFRPYTFTPHGIAELQFYADGGGTLNSDAKE